MNVMDRLFGRKARTPDTISAALSAARDALADGQARVASAADRRKAAIASGDRSAAITSESERAAAVLDAEIAADEVAGLEKGLADAVRAVEAEARATALAALVKRRKALGMRLDSEWRRAAETMASVLSSIAVLRRDVAEAGLVAEVEPLPEVTRDFIMRGSAFDAVSNYVGDALSAPLTVPESPKERARAEYQARREREREESRQAWFDADSAERTAAREAEDKRARRERSSPYYLTRGEQEDAAR